MKSKNDSIYDKPLALVTEGLEEPVKDLLTLTAYCHGDRYLRDLVYPTMVQLTADVFEIYDRVRTLADREEGLEEDRNWVRIDYWFKLLEQKVQKARSEEEHVNRDWAVAQMKKMYEF